MLGPYNPPPVGNTAIERNGSIVTFLYNSPNSGLLVLGYTLEQAKFLAEELIAAASTDV